MRGRRQSGAGAEHERIPGGARAAPERIPSGSRAEHERIPGGSRAALERRLSKRDGARPVLAEVWRFSPDSPLKGSLACVQIANRFSTLGPALAHSGANLDPNEAHVAPRGLPKPAGRLAKVDQTCRSEGSSASSIVTPELAIAASAELASNTSLTKSQSMKMTRVTQISVKSSPLCWKTAEGQRLVDVSADIAK